MNLLPPRPVLAAYGPALAGLRWVGVPGGFSGAAVWRGEDPSATPVVALKRWPGDTTPERLRFIHRAVRLASGLSFVPPILPTTGGQTVLECAGGCWDATHWITGSPCDSPTIEQVEAAGAAVAGLHSAWPVTRRGPCPGVGNRLRVLREWKRSPPALPAYGFPAPLLSLLRTSWDVVSGQAAEVARLLQPWEELPLPLRLCVRDLRGEHVLYAGDKVAGIVDYGAVAEDHASVDLARLLSDFAAGSEEHFVAGLRGYCATGEMPELDPDLVRVLLWSGNVCSVIGWVVRLVVERRSYDDVPAVLARLSRLVRRVEGCSLA